MDPVPASCKTSSPGSKTCASCTGAAVRSFLAHFQHAMVDQRPHQIARRGLAHVHGAGQSVHANTGALLNHMQGPYLGATDAGQLLDLLEMGLHDVEHQSELAQDPPAAPVAESFLPDGSASPPLAGGDFVGLRRLMGGGHVNGGGGKTSALAFAPCRVVELCTTGARILNKRDPVYTVPGVDRVQYIASPLSWCDCPTPGTNSV